MVFKKFLYVLPYHFGKFFNRKRGHTQETRAMKSVDVDKLEVLAVKHLSRRVPFR